jgi:16S rRNA (guanine966-N2)-methyltransferase
LFNILGWEFIQGATVLDLFAGTGALGLEALSRGAREAVFVDHSPLALDLIQKNIVVAGFSAQAHVVRHDLLKGLFFWRQPVLKLPGEDGRPAPPFDLVFLDPPYRQGLCPRLLTALLETGLAGEGTQVVFEDDSTESLPESVGTLQLLDQRRYGDTGFWFYEAPSSPK